MNSQKNQNKNHPKFEEGEKVLCFHGDLIYEAKCSKIDLTRPNDRFYFVHYNGWNKNWDEWVTIKRILKFNEDNVKKQQELIVQSRFTAKKARALTQNKKDDDSKKENLELGDTKKDIKLEDSEQTDQDSECKQAKRRICVVDIYSKHNNYLTNPKIKITIPLSLQEWLIDDFDAIMQQNKLVKIPNTHTVKSILDDYKVFKLNQTTNEKLIKEMTETVEGLIKYFNVMLGSQLLYKFERIQYSELLNSETEMTDVYGPIHLLRLFEKLDEIIEYAPLEPIALENLLFYVNDILKYLNMQSATLFKTNDYIIAPPNYIRAAF